MKKFAQALVKYSGVAALVGVGLVAVMSLSQPKGPKIGFVRSGELIGGYAGTQESQEMLEQRLGSAQMRVDTLAKALDRDVAAYEAAGGSQAEGASSLLDTLRVRESQLNAYASAVSEAQEKEQRRLLEGIYAQVNAYVAKYAEANGYDMIYGTTEGGSVLYGTPALDLTQDILKGLNANYHGQQNQ